MTKKKPVKKTVKKPVKPKKTAKKAKQEKTTCASPPPSSYSKPPSVSVKTAPRTISGLKALSRTERFRLAIQLQMGSGQVQEQAFLALDEDAQAVTLLQALVQRDYITQPLDRRIFVTALEGLRDLCERLAVMAAGS